MKPDFKTIADFRRDNGQAIRKVCRQFVAIDGSKCQAVNAKAKSIPREKLERRLGVSGLSVGIEPGRTAARLRHIAGTE